MTIQEEALVPEMASIIMRHISAIFICIILIIFAGFREIGFDPDSLNYASIIQSINFSNFAYLHSMYIEPSFYFIANIAHRFFGDAIRGTLIIYAVLGVSLKLVAIYRLSPIPLVSIAFYLCYYYPLHELTQIRVGVASAIFLLSIPDIANKNPKTYIIKTIIATFFHYQAIVMLPIYLILNAKIGKWFYLILPILGILSSFLREYFFNIIYSYIFILDFVPSFLSQKIILYIDLAQEGVLSDINIFNLYNMSLIVIYYFCIININKFKLNIDHIMIKILGLSTFAFPFLSFLPFFAFRISEFLGIVIMILLASIVLIFRQKIIIIFIAFIYSLIALYKTIFCTGLFKF